MKELTEAQKGYLAGILDGEGCLSIRSQKGQRSFYATLQVSNTDIKMLVYLFDITGLGRLHYSKQYQANRKDSYKWFVTVSKDIYDILDAVYPYLITKRSRADVLYQLREIKKTPLVRKGVSRGKYIASNEVVRKQKALFTIMADLNFRGRLANGENSVDTQNGQYRAELARERVTVSPEIMDISTPLERDDMTCTTKELVEVGNRKPTITE